MFVPNRVLSLPKSVAADHAEARKSVTAPNHFVDLTLGVRVLQSSMVKGLELLGHDLPFAIRTVIWFFLEELSIIAIYFDARLIVVVPALWLLTFFINIGLRILSTAFLIFTRLDLNLRDGPVVVLLIWTVVEFC